MMDSWSVKVDVTVPGGFSFSCVHTLAPAIHTRQQHLDASTETLWTGLANSAKPSQLTQHIQKASDGPVAANQKNLILSRAPSDVDKARLLAAASPHSGDWLHAPTITAVGL